MKSESTAEIKFSKDPVQIDLVEACSSGDVSRIRRLALDPRQKSIDINASVRRFRGTPLTAAAASGSLGAVQAVLHHPDVDPNRPDDFGRSAYFYALRSDNHEVMKVLKNDRRLKVRTITQAMMDVSSPEEEQVICEVQYAAAIDDDVISNFILCSPNL